MGRVVIYLYNVDAKWRPVLVLAAVAVEPIKIRRLNGARARTED